MSTVSETIVREYFESLGFLVRQPIKYQVSARKKRAAEEVDLLVSHPAPRTGRPSENMIWAGRDLHTIAQAVVSVRGWHTERFSPALLGLTPEIYRFAAPDALMAAARDLGGITPICILCISDLPSTRPARRATLELLRAKNIAGVLLFRTVLTELLERVEVTKSYEKSEVLQVFRILKIYGLLKDAQLELFARRPRRNKSVTRHEP